MSSLKSIAAACVLTTFALGCTHATDVQKRPQPTSASTPVSLQTHHWQLNQVRDVDGSTDMQWQRSVATSRVPVELLFTGENALVVKRLCNNMHGSYEAQGDALQVSRMISTMMACNDEKMMALERQVAQQLPKVQSWKITGSENAPVLALTFQGGVVWELKGKPTYETLYGPSEQMFLEVAPDKVVCHHPLVENAQCLQVREVKYDAQGIKQGFGTWGNYYGSIEGYSKQPNVRNILRIKRYTNQNAPADASKYVDVLDLVVESEIKR